MNIVGKGKKVLDADLLARLAVSGQSGGTVSIPEVKSAIKAASAELKDEFSYGDSTRGLTRAKDAVANTLELAIASGWVRSGSAQSLIREFLDGAGTGSLEQLSKDIKAEVRASGSGSSSGRVSYSGGGSRRAPVSRPSGGYAGT